MITPQQFKAVSGLPVGALIVYTVPPAQKSIIKGLTIHNTSAVACTFTVVLFGTEIYTTRTLGPLETFECASAINKIGIAGNTITVSPSAAGVVNVIGSAIELAAT